MRTAAGIVALSIIGGAIVYVVNRWLILPPTNPMMGLAPQTAFFIAHLLFGLIVGLGPLIAARRRGLLASPSPSPSS